jgi:ABC-type proline/glycine betaine transport system ATPase subunit
LTLIGKPSTGKTTAMSMVRDAVKDVEVATQIKEEDSKLINSWFKFTF